MTLQHNYRYKSIRDPLYGFIDLSKLETEIIDTRLFRRLQFIKQLSHAYVAYPSSIHTRFEHSLGTLYVSNIMAMELKFTKEEDIERIRLSCLLHDIGHGPFSHLFETIMKIINPTIQEPHEKISKIMINEDSELASILDSRRDEIIKLLGKDYDFHKESEKLLQSDIVSSGIDADKLDYLRRDSYHTGVAYGQFDFSRILHTLTTTPEGSQICISKKGKDALENYRLARYLMHIQVYGHHARLAADQMFLKSLEIAIFDEKVIDKSILEINPKKGNSEFLEFYTSLDDYSIYHKIMDSDQAKTSKLILDNIKKRKLLKRVCEFTPKDLENSADVEGKIIKMKSVDFDNIALEISESLDLESHEVIFFRHTIKNRLYQKGVILFRDGDDVYDLGEFSPISGKDVSRYLIYGPTDREIRRKIAFKLFDRLDIKFAKTSNIWRL